MPKFHSENPYANYFHMQIIPSSRAFTEPMAVGKSGDSTVNIRSLRACELFVGAQSEPVTVLPMANEDHLQMLHSKPVIQQIRTLFAALNNESDVKGASSEKVGTVGTESQKVGTESRMRDTPNSKGAPESPNPKMDTHLADAQLVFNPSAPPTRVQSGAGMDQTVKKERKRKPLVVSMFKKKSRL